jgi:hemerythrin-like domain-containing protein
MNENPPSQDEPSDPIAILMDEHRLIERALSCLHAFVEDLGSNSSPFALAELLDFFKRYADFTHHSKEEELLFAELIKTGFSPDIGPVAVMTHEHAFAREQLRALDELARNWSERNFDAVREHALTYVRLMYRHIFKEDEILYPTALAQLSESALDELGAKFTALDQANQDTLAKLREQLEAVENAFPNRPNKTSLNSEVLPEGDCCQSLCNRINCVMFDAYDDGNLWAD